MEEVQRLQNSISKLQESSMTQISRLEEQLEHKRQHIARLEARLDAQKDYDDLKREIRYRTSVLRRGLSPKISSFQCFKVDRFLDGEHRRQQVAGAAAPGKDEGAAARAGDGGADQTGATR